MKKIILVAKREYWTRVRKRSFIIMTIITPLLFAGLIGAMLWIAIYDQGDEKVIAIIDDSGLFADKFNNSDDLFFTYPNESIEQAKSEFNKLGPDGLLYIPKLDIHDPQGISLYSQSNPHFGVINEIESTLEKEIEILRMKELGVDQQLLKDIETQIDLNTLSLTSEGEKQSNAETTVGTAYVSSLLIYFFLFLYGVQVMKGVIEEKYNRIVEVIISSIKPFQLMMGKILGIAAVGLTQFTLWVLLSFAVTSAGFSLAGLDQNPSMAIDSAVMSDGSTDLPPVNQGVWELMNTIPFTYVLITFVAYFLGGYFLYASLFALVGSAVDSDADSQQFMFPITIPLIISIVALGFVLNDPDGKLAFWMSMIPLTSPVVMLGRIPFGVPGWQLALSLILLVAGFIFTTWVAGRIYRVGILTHGSKVSYRTLTKWFFQNY
jgi:ABC-2 type transport system permease protein